MTSSGQELFTPKLTLLERITTCKSEIDQANDAHEHTLDLDITHKNNPKIRYCTCSTDKSTPFASFC